MVGIKPQPPLLSELAVADTYSSLSHVILDRTDMATAKEVRDIIKVRFDGADRVKATRLSTLCGEFDRLPMDDGEEMDVYAGRIGVMAKRYAGLGATLGDTTMVKKLLDTVSDRLYAAVAGIELFCDIETIPFEEALDWLKAFDERTWSCTQEGGGHGGDQLLLTAAQWAVRRRQHGSVFDHDDDGGSSTTLGSGGKRIRRCYSCVERGHFRVDFTKPKKADEAEKALLANIDVEGPALLLSRLRG